MRVARLYQTILLVTTFTALGWGSALACGCQPSYWIFAPMLVAMLGESVRMIVVAKLEAGAQKVGQEPGQEGLPEPERRIEVGETVYLDDTPGAPAPIFLEDCATLICGPRGGGGRLKIKAVTARAFVQFGWQHNFSASKMMGFVLEDGLRTKITEGLWRDITDMMHDAKLIRKEPRKATVSLLPLSEMLGSVYPFPIPEGWRGWTNS